MGGDAPDSGAPRAPYAASPADPEQARGGRWGKVLERSLDCVHCGLCLPECPTYRETGRETSSPRGRIYLFRGVAEGRIEPGDALAEEAYLCLGCRACETACPSGVEYGSLLEDVRAEVEDLALRTGPAKWIERFALRSLVPHPRRLRAAISLLGFAQRTGLDSAARPLMPRGLRELAAKAPAVPPARERMPLPERVLAEGERRGRVALLTGCVMPELFGKVNAATARVLAANGFDVEIPRSQSCCGALHAHAGDEQTSRALARRNVAAFGAVASGKSAAGGSEGLDAVVVNSAGCGAAMRELGAWLPGEGEDLAAQVRDVCEFLDEVGLRPPTRRIDARVCYDDPCHLVHGQRVAAAPRRLLEQVPGLTLVDHADPGSCCGAAGIYNLTHREMSEAVLDRKLDALAAADPDIVATGNPGCLMQLSQGVASRGLRARVVHPVELLV